MEVFLGDPLAAVRVGFLGLQQVLFPNRGSGGHGQTRDTGVVRSHRSIGI